MDKNYFSCNQIAHKVNFCSNYLHICIFCRTFGHLPWLYNHHNNNVLKANSPVATTKKCSLWQQK